jgi:biopolymer transport protein ExbD
MNTRAMLLAALLVILGLAVSGAAAQEPPADDPTPQHPLRDKMQSDSGDEAAGLTTLTIRLNADGSVTYKGSRLTFEELERALAREYLVLDRTPEGELHARVEIIADYEQQQAQVMELMAICRDIGFKALAVESTSVGARFSGEESAADGDKTTNLVNLAALVGVVLLLVMAVCLRGGD